MSLDLLRLGGKAAALATGATHGMATDQAAPLHEGDRPFSDRVTRRRPAERWGDLEDPAGAAIFLASAAIDFANGRVLNADGHVPAATRRPLYA